MSEHTPGPWRAAELRRDGVVIQGSGWEIRTPHFDVGGYRFRAAPFRKEADAVLAAAAPDLLAACEAAHEWVQDVHVNAPISFGGTDVAIGIVLQAAIARAKGNDK